jgi:prophage antirepressor-like protein
MTKRDRILLLGALAFVVVGALTRLIPTSMSPQLEAVQAQGDSVVSAIERYRSVLGQPPHTLEELVPTYLVAVPSPAWGTRAWRFTRWIGDSVLPQEGSTGSLPGSLVPDYTLAVSSGPMSDSIFYYSSRLKRWSLDR